VKLFLFLCIFICGQIYAENVILTEWLDANSVCSNLKVAQSHGLSYFSQFHVYDVRGKDIHSSKFRAQTNEIPYIYALDFYYASGSYFSEDYIKRNRENIIEIVKFQWRENKAIPSFSWHLENPYVPSDFGEYMGCRYRWGHKTKKYPDKHRYVIREILNRKGEPCGFGTFKNKHNDKGTYNNPAEWFNDRCKEVAAIINELVDDEGNPIPIIFRLWHECEDSWMWWGATSVSKKDYQKFFILTERKIKKYAPKSQILWAYCMERNWQTVEEYMSRYPGDKYVDIIGYDDYQIGNPNKIKETLNKARIVTSVAESHGKVAALFETANTVKQKEDEFFERHLLPLIQDEKVRFGIIQMWGNGPFVTESQFDDRKKFLKSKQILMIK